MTKQNDTKHIGLALSPEVYELLKKVCKDNCRSVGKQIEYWIRQETTNG